MAIYVLQTRRGTETAEVSGTNIFDWMEEKDIKVFDYNQFFNEELDKTLIKKNDIIVFYTTIPEDTKYDNRSKAIKCKKIFRSLDGYNTDGIPFRKTFEKMKRIDVKKMAYCHKNKNIDTFLKKVDCDSFYMPHCIDFSNKRTSFDNKIYDISISGHLSHEVYPIRTRVFNYFNKVKSDDLKISFLPHPGYELISAKHQITGEKYIDFLSSNWLNVTCRAGWRDGLVAKYIEIGKSNSLPVCDVPTCLEKEIADLVISVDDTIDNTMMKDKIINAISNKNSLKERIKEYQYLTEKFYNKNLVIDNFIKNCMDV